MTNEWRLGSNADGPKVKRWFHYHENDVNYFPQLSLPSSFTGDLDVSYFKCHLMLICRNETPSRSPLPRLSILQDTSACFALIVSILKDIYCISNLDQINTLGRTINAARALLCACSPKVVTKKYHVIISFRNKKVLKFDAELCSMTSACGGFINIPSMTEENIIAKGHFSNGTTTVRPLTTLSCHYVLSHYRAFTH